MNLLTFLRAAFSGAVFSNSMRMGLIISSFMYFSIVSAKLTSALAEQECLQKASDILIKLRCLNLVKVEEVTTSGEEATAYRQFEILIEQPVNHFSSESSTFKQRVVVLHRSENLPLILQTSGYSIFGVRETAIAKIFNTNQIQIEHRFFANSRPEVLDWQHLNILQSAHDFHKITLELKKIYNTPWVNTGASKGGMTSVYHRRFFPDDLVGTVADVAPHSYSRADKRYVTFIENVGGEEYKTCRENLNSLQINLLKNRKELLPQISGEFTVLGNANIAFEHAVLESSFLFWQYGNPDSLASGCGVLAEARDLSAQFAFLKSHADPQDYSDESVLSFQPYYYQAATQLGGPDSSTAHLEPFRLFELSIDQYAPKNIPLPYNNSAMHDVGDWIKNAAQNVIMVYGELDPWTAAAFPDGKLEQGVKKYFVPKGNHGAKFINLPAAQKSEVLNILTEWLGVPPNIESLKALKSAGQKGAQTLEDLEFKARRRYRL